MSTPRILIGLDDIANADNLTESEKRKMATFIKDMAKERERPKRQPAPEGSISVREASDKYEVPSPTISRWVKKGLIPVALRTKNWLYIDEDKLVEVVKRYKLNPGRGKKTIKRINN
jgi:hypothetical protein